LTYALSRIDESGAVAATHVLERLGWRTGDRLAVTTARNIVVVRRKRDGLQAVPKRPLLVIPAAARRTCGIRTGDSLLLAAAIEVDTVLIHPPAVLDKMMTLYYHQVPGDD
jgi:bifunctional DNA-binding transcriptional regulator/antitoxin component of YhaV-PrlF toxin-antitoxin module